MKKEFFAIMMISATTLFAGSGSLTLTQSNNIATNAASTASVISSPINGYLDSIFIDLQSTVTTCHVSIVTATNAPSELVRNVLTVSNITASGIYRPRYPVHTFDGTQFGLTTNLYERLLLDNTSLKVSIYGANATNKNVKVRAGIWQ